MMHSFKNSCSHHNAAEVLIICLTFSECELIIWDALTSDGAILILLPAFLIGRQTLRKGNLLFIFVSAPGTVPGTKSVLSM